MFSSGTTQGNFDLVSTATCPKLTTISTENPRSAIQAGIF